MRHKRSFPLVILSHGYLPIATLGIEQTNVIADPILFKISFTVTVWYVSATVNEFKYR